MATDKQPQDPTQLRNLKAVWQIEGESEADPHFNDAIKEQPATSIYATPTGSSIPRRTHRRKRPKK